VFVNDGVKDMTLTIVDSHESDFMRGKISLYSPIGKELMGRKVGENVEVTTVNGKVGYTVVSVN